MLLAVVMFMAMSAPLMHVHAAHACNPQTHSSGSGDAAGGGHLHRDGKTHEAPDHAGGGLDCCIHHSPVVSPHAGASMIARIDRSSGRVALPDDLVLDATGVSRLERPPRNLLST
jgi:hypothetical protein